jgi:ABC-type nitrate/sulfonate/bicarbonate transport system ATPase subunit
VFDHAWNPWAFVECAFRQRSTHCHLQRELLDIWREMQMAVLFTTHYIEETDTFVDEFATIE